MSDLLNKNIAFYNTIAGEYDARHADEKSGRVRVFVKDYLLTTVRPCRILDFGGGTGADSAWLIENNFSVIFCEPADKMRDAAIRKMHTAEPGRIRFLEGDENNFETWTKTHLPFEKADCTLANFNVLNSIRDPRLLFANLRMGMNPGAHFIGTMLNTRFIFKLKKKPAYMIHSLFHKHDQKQDPLSQDVFRHSPGEVRAAAGTGFSLHRLAAIPKTDFLLYDFTCNA